MNIEKQIRVLLFPISEYDRKSNAEHIENSGYTISELQSVLAPNVLLYTLTDFMDACNDEEIELDNYWVSYIRVIDEIENHNNNINTVIKSCEEGRDGDWDCSTSEGKEGFDDMITMLEKCIIKF